MARGFLYILILALILGSFFAYKAANNSAHIIPIPETMNNSATVTSSNKIPDFQNWHEFTAPNNKFKVLLPVLPQHATENINDPISKGKRKYDMFVSEQDNGTVFMITVIEHTELKNDNDKVALLNQTMNDMLNSNPKNNLISSKTGEYKGNTSIDFSLTNDDVQIEARAIVVEDNLIVLSMISKKQNYNPNEFPFFVNSFEIVKK